MKNEFANCEHGVVGKYCFRCKRPDLAIGWEEKLNNYEYHDEHGIYHIDNAEYNVDIPQLTRFIKDIESLAIEQFKQTKEYKQLEEDAWKYNDLQH